MKELIRKWVWLLLTVLWMAAIFLFSAEPAEESTELSMGVGIRICQVFVPDFEDMEEASQLQLAAAIDHPVRKCAHATEYAILSILICMTLSKWKKGWRLRFQAAALAAAIYACTDEVHQLFVPGRSGQIGDVLIDTGGALIGVLLLCLLCLIRRRRQKNT